MKAIFKTLESIRKKLLDTTRRNRLINFNLNQKDCLRVVDELPNQLFDVLTNGKSMSFQAIPEPSRKQLIEKGYIAVNPETKKDEEIKPNPSAKQWAKEIGIDANFELPLTSSTEEGNDKHTDLDLQTLFYPYELDTRLKKIYQKVQSSINETGANILYISIGYLEWNEGGEKNSFAPLLLIPVELEKGKLNIKKQVYEYKISYSEQNIVNNISLREKLKKDFGLSLPKFAEDSDPEKYLEESYKTIVQHVTLMLEFQKRGTVTFDYGNNLRGRALEKGLTNAFDFPGFVPAFIRPQFCEGRGPFRWVALSGDPEDIYATDRKILELFPEDEGLKRWIKMSNEKEITDEQIEAEYDGYAKGLKWQLIQGKIFKDNEIKLENEEVMAYTKGLLVNNYAQYGMPAPEDEELTKSAMQVLQNKEEGSRIYDMLAEQKLTTFFKETVKLNEKAISYDEFVEMAK